MRNQVIDMPKCLQTSEPPEPFELPTQADSPQTLTPRLLRSAFLQSLVMLRPDIQKNNPTMFVVEITAIVTLLCILMATLFRAHGETQLPYLVLCDAVLFLTVISANFSTALNTARLARRDCSFHPPRDPHSFG